MSQRARRVAGQVQEVLAELLVDLKDPRLGFLTITDVRVSTDLGQAEVFYTALPDDPDAREATAAGLASAAPLLRRELGTTMRLRRVPDLSFVHDPVPEQGRRIERLLERDGGSREGEPGMDS